ncbi:hypothetical protein SBA5_1100011 [Candidatus Sulfotelmatomonas gaucii]|uniref:Uncharacterized protein n=1 Tax=Candidatus Sulfuritelmatomonas gaucii TaxID=2043161 RepID=A0A2N9L3N5_9BACT|nr:hypothetical protein SBA5_1100011 [Candidatus Sulfotelmatomonas gaucii]
MQLNQGARPLWDDRQGEIRLLKASGEPMPSSGTSDATEGEVNHTKDIFASASLSI